MDFKEN